MCNHFYNTGQCDYGDRCTFSHIDTKPGVQAPKQSRTLPAVDKLIQKEEPLTSPAMRDLILSALQRANAEAVVLLGTNANGLAKLRECLRAPYELGAGTRGNVFSFQCVAVPLVTLLTRSHLAPSHCHAL